MATNIITDEKKKVILADWQTGDFTQRDLAHKYKLSTGAIAKITKDEPKSTAHIVSKIVEAKQELSQLDEQTVKAVNDVVDSKVKWLDYLNKAALKNVQQSMAAPCVDQQDFRSRAQTIGIAKEVLVGKNPDVAVQVNTQVTNETTKSEFGDIALRLLNR